MSNLSATQILQLVLPEPPVHDRHRMRMGALDIARIAEPDDINAEVKRDIIKRCLLPKGQKEIEKALSSLLEEDLECSGCYRTLDSWDIEKDTEKYYWVGRIVAAFSSLKGSEKLTFSITDDDLGDRAIQMEWSRALEDAVVESTDPAESSSPEAKAWFEALKAGAGAGASDACASALFSRVRGGGGGGRACFSYSPQLQAASEGCTRAASGDGAPDDDATNAESFKSFVGFPGSS